ncbi:MAG TPA: hypothetical protein VKW78_21305 [Terriglobales bacterium]|jgi:DNA/RNA endonuclease YhcR with UshA esterase domain|nr:hypothetical protein [Terriglobales bacterium]HZP31938.1 hypothetical protein [Candidatus Acidoferrales bacterium]
MKQHFAGNKSLRIALSLTIASGFALASYAQIPSGRGRGPIYNSATEITVKGTVEAVNQVTAKNGWGGTHLQLKTESETLDVHVGPSWFLSQNKMSFAKGDQVEVTGSKVKFANGDALVARDITRGDQKLKLRNDKGFPVWSRRGAR